MPIPAKALKGVFLATALMAASPSIAWFEGVPILDKTEEELRKKAKEAEENTRKALKAVEDGIQQGADALTQGAGEVIKVHEKVWQEAEIIARKTIKEIGNAAEDLRILAEEGTCGGDICDALKATATFVESSINDGGKAIETAEKRVAEGKPIDALWHLSIAPSNITQDNAAKAVMQSSVLRAVGQTAATAYGGPAGAAAYAAWLAYHESGGNIELALKTGAIAGATAYAMSAISNDAPTADLIKDVKGDEILQRAIMTGAVSGAGVALSGGSKEDVEKAFVTGAVTSVIRDSYKELTKSNLEDRMKASTGDGYCLKAAPDSGLSCLPPRDAYIKEGDEILYNDNGSPKIDYTKLRPGVPLVGAAAEVQNGPWKTETSGFMKFLSRIPGMNGMALAHDIFDAATNPETTFIVEQAYRIGTITPFIIMTYEGAGVGVQEAIRNTAIKYQQKNQAAPLAGSAPAMGAAPLPATTSTTAASPATVSPENETPIEIQHLYCKHESEPLKNLLFENKIEPTDPASYERICRIDQNIGGDKWKHVWHAHYQKSSCVIKFNELFMRYINKGYTCYTNQGLRFDPKVKPVTLTAQP